MYFFKFHVNGHIGDVRNTAAHCAIDCEYTTTTIVWKEFLFLFNVYYNDCCYVLCEVQWCISDWLWIYNNCNYVQGIFYFCLTCSTMIDVIFHVKYSGTLSDWLWVYNYYNYVKKHFACYILCELQWCIKWSFVNTLLLQLCEKEFCMNYTGSQLVIWFGFLGGLFRRLVIQLSFPLKSLFHFCLLSSSAGFSVLSSCALALFLSVMVLSLL